MSVMKVEIGEYVQFAKTVSESDIYMFAGITGDFSGNHVNQEFMRTSIYGERVAHGALLVGFMSTTSTMIIARCLEKGATSTPVSLGYDRIRFLNPVFIGDTITVRYEIVEITPSRKRTKATIQVTNQHGKVVAVAEHILKWLPRTNADPDLAEPLPSAEPINRLS